MSWDNARRWEKTASLGVIKTTSTDLLMAENFATG